MLSCYTVVRNPFVDCFRTLVKDWLYDTYVFVVVLQNSMLYDNSCCILYIWHFMFT